MNEFKKIATQISDATGLDYDDVCAVLAIIPHVGVQEVKHAKWKLISTYRYEEGCLNDIFRYDIFRCSNCSIPSGDSTKYCPHCGCIMDGDERNEQ